MKCPVKRSLLVEVNAKSLTFGDAAGQLSRHASEVISATGQKNLQDL